MVEIRPFAELVNTNSNDSSNNVDDTKSITSELDPLDKFKVLNSTKNTQQVSNDVRDFLQRKRADARTDVDKMFDKFREKNPSRYKGPIFGNVNQLISKMMNDGRNAINNTHNTINFDYLIPNVNKFQDTLLNKLQFIQGNDQQTAKVIHFLAYKILKKDPMNVMGIRMNITIPFDNRISEFMKIYSEFCGIEDTISFLKYFPLVKIDTKEFYQNVYDFIETFRDFIYDRKLIYNDRFIIKDVLYTLLTLASTDINGRINYDTLNRIYSTLLLENINNVGRDRDYKIIDSFITNVLFELMDCINPDQLKKLLAIVNKNTRRPKKGCKVLFINSEDCPNLYHLVNEMKLNRELDNLIANNK